MKVELLDIYAAHFGIGFVNQVMQGTSRRLFRLIDKVLRMWMCDEKTNSSKFVSIVGVAKIFLMC